MVIKLDFETLSARFINYITHRQDIREYTLKSVYIAILNSLSHTKKLIGEINIIERPELRFF
jgi:hypothetical protein